MEKPFSYIDYDKIYDDVLTLSNHFYLRMNVSLSSKTDGSRRIFHTETSYVDKYGNNLISIKRSFVYYLSLTKTDEGAAVMIRPQDMIILRKSLMEVESWLNNSTEIFRIKKKKLVIVNRPQPIVVGGLAGNEYIAFEPIVYQYDETTDTSPGVRITLGQSNAFADITIDRFYALLYIISSFDMYGAAQNLINYIGRAEYGTNITHYNFGRGGGPAVEYPEDNVSGGVDNRRIGQSTRTPSFFEKRMREEQGKDDN
jgi:hypothetical protein